MMAFSLKTDFDSKTSIFNMLEIFETPHFSWAFQIKIPSHDKIFLHMINSIDHEPDKNLPKVLSIRGNHDSFNELDLSQSHYVQNLKNDSISTHLYTIQKPYGNYSLLSVDAAPNPGFKRPFNFVGYISDQSKIDLEQLGNEAKSNNQTVLYGHYPSSSKFFFSRSMKCPKQHVNKVFQIPYLYT